MRSETLLWNRLWTLRILCLLVAPSVWTIYGHQNGLHWNTASSLSFQVCDIIHFPTSFQPNFPLSGLLDGQEKLLDILQGYYCCTATYYPNPDDAGSTTYFSRVGMNFIRESCSELSELKPTSAMFSRHDKLLQSLVAGLQIHHDDPEAGCNDRDNRLRSRDAVYSQRGQVCLLSQ